MPFYHGGHLTKDLYGSVPSLLSGGSIVPKMKAVTNALGGVYWAGIEGTGTTLYAYNTALDKGRNIIINGGFASDTIWSKGTGWSIAAGVATHAAGTASNLAQNDLLETGVSYETIITVSGRTAGSVQVVLGGTGGTARSTDDTFTETVVCGATNLHVQIYADANFDGSVDDVSVKRLNILPSSAYPGGVGNPLNGSLTGITWTAVSPPLGPYAPYFDGTNDFGNFYSKALNAFFNPNAGTLAVVGKVSGAGVWTDGLIHVLVMIESGATNRISMYKNSVNNQMRAYAYFDGTLKEIIISSISYLTPFLFCITWDKVADEVRVFLNGAQQGATLTGLGSFVGNLVSSVIGAQTTTPSNPWSGLDHHVLLGRSVMTPAANEQLAKEMGVFGT